MQMTSFDQVLRRGMGEPVISFDQPQNLDAGILVNVRKIERRSQLEVEFQEASMAACSLNQAEQYKLQTEWMVTFLREIRAGATTGEAVAAAEMEWDT